VAFLCLRRRAVWLCCRSPQRIFFKSPIISPPLKGEAPTIDLVIGYHKANTPSIAGHGAAKVPNAWWCRRQRGTKREQEWPLQARPLHQGGGRHAFLLALDPRGSPIPYDGVAGHGTRSTAKNGLCRSVDYKQRREMKQESSVHDRGNQRGHTGHPRNATSCPILPRAGV